MSKITISLNNPKSSELQEDEFIFFHKIEQVLDLIKSRVDEIEYEENNDKDDNKKNATQRFKKLKMHDAILVDGKRGSGKTTYLNNIAYVLEQRKSKIKVKILGSIDPNQLDEKSNILLIIIANIYTELLDSVKTGEGNREVFKNLNIEINNLTASIRNAENRTYKDSYDHLYGLHKSLTVDEELHNFFLHVCEFYQVKALILPIDDIDMDFKHGYKVLDTIRKYLSTPKIIPIIAVDTAQAYALVKKEHYEYFSYETKTKKSEIEHGSELGFLRKLPNEYLQKILKPTRRIMIPDMLDIYKSHLRALEKKNNPKDQVIIFSFINGTDKFKMSFEILLKRYMNIVYGYNGNDIENPDNYRVVNYLKNKSLRSFFEDMISFLNGIEKVEKYSYIYNMEPLKERLNPNYMEKLHNKYDATEWAWEYYIEKLDQVIIDYKKRSKDIGETRIFVNILKNIMIINGKELHSTTRNEKTYARLFMQDFFLKDIVIDISKIQGSIIKDFDVIKTINLGGLLELMLRVFVPMSIFENLANNNKIDVLKFNYEEFRQFAKDDISNSLKNSMHALSIWPKKYFYVESKDSYKYNNSKKENEYKLIGIEVYTADNKEDTSYGILQDKTSDYENTTTNHKAQTYYISPLKYYAFLSEYFQISMNNDKIKKLMKYYNDVSRKEDLSHKETKKLSQENYNLTFTNSNIGILSIIKYSKSLTKNILEATYSNYKKDNFNLKIDGIEKRDIDKRFIDKNISNYKIQFFHHLIIYLHKNATEYFEDMNIRDDSIYVGTRELDFYKYKNTNNDLFENINIIHNYQNNNKVVLNKNMNDYIKNIVSYINKDEYYKNSFISSEIQKSENLSSKNFKDLELFFGDYYKKLNIILATEKRKFYVFQQKINMYLFHNSIYNKKTDEDMIKDIQDFCANEGIFHSKVSTLSEGLGSTILKHGIKVPTPTYRFYTSMERCQNQYRLNRLIRFLEKLDATK